MPSIGSPRGALATPPNGALGHQSTAAMQDAIAVPHPVSPPPQPSAPLTLLSLSDDALVRILSQLGSPLPGDAPFLAPQHTSHRHSPAAALAMTCVRLYNLHRESVVTCVDLSRGECGCGLAAALARHPRADAAALGTSTVKHGEAVSRYGDLGILAQLSALCVSGILSVSLAHLLAESLPQLRELDIFWDDDDHPPCSPYGFGLKRVVGKLPAGLRRLRLSYPLANHWKLVDPDQELNDSLWNSIGTMEELEELQVGYLSSIRWTAMAAVARCHRLRKLSVKCWHWDMWDVPVSRFVEALTSSLTGMKLKSIVTQSILSTECFARLVALESLHVEGINFANWEVLKPAVPRLRELTLGCIFDPGGRLPSLVRLEVIDLKHVRDVQAGPLFALLGSTSVLKELHVGSVNLSDATLAAYLLSAACGRTLRVLEFCGGGDATVSAIGERFVHLRELSVSFSRVTSVGLSFVGQGCPQLTKLLMSQCCNFDDEAAAIASVGGFPKLDELSLEGMSITSEGLMSLKLGCETLTKLFIIRNDYDRISCSLNDTAWLRKGISPPRVRKRGFRYELAFVDRYCR